MAAAKGIVLAANVNASVDQAPMTWSGGRAALVLIAAAYGTTVTLQCLGPDNATWIGINGTTFSANQVTPFDLPAGQYRLHITGGTTTGLYANLVSTPYV